MNQLMLLIFALVVFVYFGGSMVPSVLRQNKQLLLGVAIGCVICCATGMVAMPSMPGMAGMASMGRMEGMKNIGSGGSGGSGRSVEGAGASGAVYGSV